MTEDLTPEDLRRLGLTWGLKQSLLRARALPAGTLKTDAYGAGLGALRRRGLVAGTLLTDKGVAARRLLQAERLQVLSRADVAREERAVHG